MACNNLRRKTGRNESTRQDEVTSRCYRDSRQTELAPTADENAGGVYNQLAQHRECFVHLPTQVVSSVVAEAIKMFRAEVDAAI